MSSRSVRPDSQKGRQLARLKRDWPNWTAAYELRNPDGKGEILQQNARLWELKHIHGYDIENRERWVDGICFSEYRLRSPEIFESPQIAIPVQAASSSTAQSWSLFGDLAPERHRDDG